MSHATGRGRVKTACPVQSHVPLSPLPWYSGGGLGWGAFHIFHYIRSPKLYVE